METQEEYLTKEQIKIRQITRTSETIAKKIIELPVEHQTLIHNLLASSNYGQINNITQVLSAILILSRDDSEPEINGPTITELTQALKEHIK